MVEVVENRHDSLSLVSTWAEYTVIPEVCRTVIDPAVSFEVAALIGCGVHHGSRGRPPPEQPRSG